MFNIAFNKITRIIGVIILIAVLIGNNASAEEVSFNAASGEGVCVSSHSTDGTTSFYCESYNDGVLISMNANCAGRCTDVYQVAIVDPYSPDALAAANLPSSALLLPNTDPSALTIRLTAFMPTHVAVVGGPSVISNQEMRSAFLALYEAADANQPIVFDRFYGQTRVETMLSTFDANLAQSGGASGK